MKKQACICIASHIITYTQYFIAILIDETDILQSNKVIELKTISQSRAFCIFVQFASNIISLSMPNQ